MLECNGSLNQDGSGGGDWNGHYHLLVLDRRSYTTVYSLLGTWALRIIIRTFQELSDARGKRLLKSGVQIS